MISTVQGHPFIGRMRSFVLAGFVLSLHDERAVVQSVIDAGAHGFLTKRSIGSELIPAVEAVLRGDRYDPGRHS